MDVLVIVLAGPAANLLGAAVTAVLASTLWAHGVPSLFLWLMTFTGVGLVVGNLHPSGPHGDHGLGSDGRWAEIAWRAMHAPAGPGADWRDPNTVGPPTP